MWVEEYIIDSQGQIRIALRWMEDTERFLKETEQKPANDCYEVLCLHDENIVDFTVK
tara:strand:- start:318 stop:488 length:171 start_codon:yes stop_codon:yes gene_type:complete